MLQTRDATNNQICGFVFWKEEEIQTEWKNKFDIKKVELDFDSFVKLLLGENAIEYG